MRILLGVLAALVLDPLSSPTLAATPLGPSSSPRDYVMAKLERHQVVLLGEAHWVKHDAQLVGALVPRLAERKVVLAMETLAASEQPALDRLLAAPEWNEGGAMRLMRAGAWPWREYLEILRAAWEANRKAPQSLRLVALGPPPDWRESLLRAKGITYEQFMADLVSAETSAERRVLVYCGLHHAFTRYYQPELDLAGHAARFMDRTGNILRRRLGERVFLITLHAPVWCGKEPWSYCLPLEGAIDCAAAKAGTPTAFDVAGTPLGDLAVGQDVYYAHGYPALRYGDLTDGVIWTRPIERYENVTLISLAEFAPDEASLREVAANNPFSNDKDSSEAQLKAQWDAEAKRRADVLASRRWSGLAGWRERCAKE